MWLLFEFYLSTDIDNITIIFIVSKNIACQMIVNGFSLYKLFIKKILIIPKKP